jgi:hypothetical protein
MYRSLLFVGVALVAVLVVGCVPVPAGSPGNTPVAAPTTGAAGELSPEIANQAAEWLAGEANVSVDELSLVQAEQVVWTDSCFGLGGPAESCLAESTPGWRITFEAGGQQYEVRTDEAGSAFRLAPQES